MPIQRTKDRERLMRLELLIEEYRRAKQERVMRRAMAAWREAESDQRLARHEAQPERIH
jgi:hypothetical protein